MFGKQYITKMHRSKEGNRCSGGRIEKLRSNEKFGRQNKAQGSSCLMRPNTNMGKVKANSVLSKRGNYHQICVCLVEGQVGVPLAARQPIILNIRMENMGRDKQRPREQA